MNNGLGRMMRVRLGVMLLAALAAGACKDEGGELREVTERRRAELDTTTADARDTGAAADTGAAIPAFVSDTAKTAKTDTAKPDSGKVAAGDVATGWTAGVRDARHAGTSATLYGLRAAANAGFDRVVLDFGNDPVPGWHAEYVNRPVQQCGSGQTVDVGTPAVLSVHLRYTQAHDDAGRPTIRQRDLPLSMSVMKRLVIICDFEGEVEVVIGASSAQPYRVTELKNPSRLAIDIQQKP